MGMANKAEEEETSPSIEMTGGAFAGSATSARAFSGSPDSEWRVGD